MKNMVIVYNGREGSSAIVSSLGKHSSISVPIFEHLDYRNIKTVFGHECVGKVHVALKNLLNGYVFGDDVFEDHQGSGSGDFSIVFKWRPCGDVAKVASSLLSTETSVVSLARRDLINFALSKYYTNVVLGEGKPVYHPQFELRKMSEEKKKDFLEEIQKGSFVVEIDKLLKIIRDTVDSKLQLQSKVKELNKLGVKTKNVFYEDYLADNKAFLSALLSDLELEFEESVLKSDFVKVNRDNLRDQVLNIKEVEADREVCELVARYLRLF